MMRTRLRLALFTALLLLACNAPFTASGSFPTIKATQPLVEIATPNLTTLPDDATCGLNALTTIDGDDVSDWMIYCDTTYGFGFKYPGGGPPTPLTDAAFQILLPIQPGTTLVEKSIDVLPVEGSSLCSNINAQGNVPSEEVTINGESFVKDMGGGVATGNLYTWVAYSTGRSNRCVTLTFTLHDTDAGNYVSPPPQSDRDAESAVFLTIMHTFRWTKP